MANTQDFHKCNDCPLATWEHVYGGEYNLKCERDKRYVDWSVTRADAIPCPTWCKGKPKGEVSEQKSCVNDWEDIKPRINWEDIREGEIYHVPPFRGNPRKDIKIISRFPNYCTYKDLKNPYCTLFYLYKNDVMHRLLGKQNKNAIVYI